ncbi:MAG TPA: YiiX/YebB-like N1pC/P60 family cysteine hydrolase [Caldilineaceae bacterium]|nr:YiiX/YebB-like N1pC/P60 family cysteine hydrolase [Caldilineaceae bacterium]
MELHEGDLLFITGKTWRSRIVQLATGKTSGYSHVGLVTMREGEPYVIHASPTPLQHEQNGSVRIEPITTFLSPESVVDGAVYRLISDPHGKAHTAVIIAEGFEIAHIGFDHHFDRSESDKLYCTELVWLAYRVAGLELLGEQSDAIDDIIFPSQLSQSPYLTEIARFEVSTPSLWWR